MATKLTKNTADSSIAYIEDEGSRQNNLQSICEALGGLAAGEGQATWTTSATLTVNVNPTSSAAYTGFFKAVYDKNPN